MDIFFSCPLEEKFNVIFQSIVRTAKEINLIVYRIDQESKADPIAETIEFKIRDCRFLIADITGSNPNVLNEIGQAKSLGKPIILISQDKPEYAPFNIRNLRIIKYSTQDLKSLNLKLKQALSESTTPTELIRTMLVPSSLGHPTNTSKFVIAVSPLSYRRAMGRSGGYKKLRRTTSDYVGLRGILQSFGLLYGFNTLPDVLDVEDCDDNVLREIMTIYCIASPKANRWTSKILEEYQKRWVPKLEFRADPLSKNLRNIRVSIFSDDTVLHPHGWHINAEGDRYWKDFGLIVRGPNPYCENKMVSILAGRSSLGTEAACTAFTDPNIIRQIRMRLDSHNVDIENHNYAFWAIVSMERSRDDEKEEAILNSLKLHQVEIFSSF